VPRGTLDSGLSLPLSHTGLLPSVVSAFHPLILLDSVNHSTSPQPELRNQSLDDISSCRMFAARPPGQSGS
jgi:hypothetical protein